MDTLKEYKRQKNEKQTIQGYFEHKPLDRFQLMKRKRYQRLKYRKVNAKRKETYYIYMGMNLNPTKHPTI